MRLFIKLNVVLSEYLFPSHLDWFNVLLFLYAPWDSYRRTAIEVYKVINKECPVYLQDLIHIKNNSYSFRYQNIAELPQVRTTSYGLQSFRYAGTKLWNELPDEFRKQSSLNQFKTLISSWSGSSCQCFACKTS